MGKGKETFNTTLDARILREAKKLAIDLGRSYNGLFEDPRVDGGVECLLALAHALSPSSRRRSRPA